MKSLAMFAIQTIYACVNIMENIKIVNLALDSYLLHDGDVWMASLWVSSRFINSQFVNSHLVN